MLTNYYTLKALAEAWSADLPGCIVGDVYSQSRDELTVALAMPESTWMVRASTHAGFPYVFRSEGYNRARRNVASLFPDALDKKLAGVRLADRDRVLYFDLEDGTRFQFMLFGPRANVLYVDDAGIILDAFQHGEELKGQPAPEPKPAPEVDTLEIFLSRWRPDRKTTIHAISAAFPFFNAVLAEEVFHRATPLPDKPENCTSEDLQRIFIAAQTLNSELRTPTPCLYWRSTRAVQFSLAPLHHLAHFREEPFEDTDKAVTVYVRRRLGQQAFEAVYTPIEKALESARDGYRKRLETMLDSLSEESRADKYEQWGHLLMAAQANVPAQVEEVVLDDLFAQKPAEAVQVVIPLDPALSTVENAQRYYEKARKTRQARQHAEERLAETEHRALEAETLLDRLRTLDTREAVEKFAKAEAERLAPFLGQQTAGGPQVPFRRFELAGGYEVWVGKNAKQNDALTFQHARKFDYWLHARGVPGSHTVLRLPGRTAQTPKYIMEAAAGIAAYFSKARGSGLVPVIVAERKYVRKPRGASLGTVVVEKEQVLLVEPGLPGE